MSDEKTKRSSRIVDVPRPTGGTTRTRLIAQFRTTIGGKRLTLLVLRLPNREGVSLTEAGSLCRFPEYVATHGARLTVARAVTMGRAVAAAAVETYGAAHVLKVIAKATKATKAGRS